MNRIQNVIINSHIIIYFCREAVKPDTEAIVATFDISFSSRMSVYVCVCVCVYGIRTQCLFLNITSNK